MINLSAPHLRRHPPRSVRVRIGGYAHPAQLIDKARAVLGKRGGIQPAFNPRAFSRLPARLPR